MAEEWREFEQLVSRIERVLGPLGAVVTSPDRIRDSVTGQLREVDASIRPQKDAPPIRVLECRDRAGVEDVTWIEQIIGKILGHGVPTIAVSSKGFSKSAITKASHHGIETRIISTLTHEEMINWVPILAVEHEILQPPVRLELEICRICCDDLTAFEKVIDGDTLRVAGEVKGNAIYIVTSFWVGK